MFSATSRFRGRNHNTDDTAIIPAKGFLSDFNNISLPTYQPKDLRIPSLSVGIWVSLTISDVLGAIRKDSHLARCVLFETARLQRPLLSMRKVKLSQDIRVIDMQLVELDKVLQQGLQLIKGEGIMDDEDDDEDKKNQDLLLEGEPFQDALRTKSSFLTVFSSSDSAIMSYANDDGEIIGIAKRSLLEIEKTFDGEILSELKNGMQSKASVDHTQIIEKVKKLEIEIQKIYRGVTTAYHILWGDMH